MENEEMVNHPKQYGNFLEIPDELVQKTIKYKHYFLTKFYSYKDECLYIGIDEEHGTAVMSNNEEFNGTCAEFHFDKETAHEELEKFANDKETQENISKAKTVGFPTKESMRAAAGLPPTTKEINGKIKDVYEAMIDLNIYKNTQYGNIGSNPLNLFARYMDKSTPALNGIYQRLDDKLSRIKNCPDKQPRINDVVDVIGYLNLLLVNLGVTKEDIAKFKD